MLDFYLKYEKYKDDFNSILLTCPDLDTYEAEWDLYENTLANYRIPPYVVAEVGGVARFIDMAPGTYEFYEVLIPSLYGDLLLSGDFDGGAPTKITGADVTISIGVNPPI